MGPVTNIAYLLADLRARGVRFAAVGDRLRVEAPRGTVPAELLEVMSQRKAEILVLLRADREPGATTWPTRRCQACNSFLFWQSIHEAVSCALCHPPPARNLVSEWGWLPEGEAARLQ